MSNFRHISVVPEFYTPAELAELLKLSVHTLASWRRMHLHTEQAKGPPWVEIEGSIRYQKDTVAQWLAARTRNGADA